MPRVMPAKDPVTGKFLKKGQKPGKTPKKAAPKKATKLKAAPKKGAKPTTVGPKPDKQEVKPKTKAKKSKENPWSLEEADKPVAKVPTNVGHKRRPSGKDAEDFVANLKEALRKR